MTSESGADEASLACRACGGPLRVAFEVEVLGDTKATYHQCARCRSMMALNPSWLERSYATTLYPDPDTGALRRTLYVNRFIRRMRASGLMPRGYRSLDYGSGLGMLVALQLDRKAKAFGFDRYASPRFAQLVCGKTLPDGPFDLITAVEVAEHLTNPVEVFSTLSERLAPNGVVMLSTELYQQERWPDPSKWHYVDREHGQHIMLFTLEGLKRAAEAAGLRHVRTFFWGRTPFLHLFVRAQRTPPRVRLGMLAWQQFWGEVRESFDLGV